MVQGPAMALTAAGFSSNYSRCMLKVRGLCCLQIFLADLLPASVSGALLSTLQPADAHLPQHKLQHPQA